MAVHTWKQSCGFKARMCGYENLESERPKNQCLVVDRQGT